MKPTPEPNTLCEADARNRNLLERHKSIVRSREMPNRSDVYEILETTKEAAARLIAFYLDPAFPRASVRKLTPEQMNAHEA